jgi:hypothetical protein
MLLSNITNQMRLFHQDPNIPYNYTFEINTLYYLVNEDNYKDLFPQLKLVDWSKMEYSEQKVPIQSVYWLRIEYFEWRLHYLGFYSFQTRRNCDKSAFKLTITWSIAFSEQKYQFTGSLKKIKDNIYVGNKILWPFLLK